LIRPEFALHAASQQVKREVGSALLGDPRGLDRGVCERDIESSIRTERPLDAEHDNVSESGSDQFLSQLGRVVVIGREVVSIPLNILTVLEDLEEKLANCRVSELALRSTEAWLRPPRNRRYRDDSARHDTAERFAERQESIRPRWEVVERAHQEDGVGRLALEWQVTGITDGRIDLAGLRLFDVLGHRIEQGHAVPAVLEPSCVAARTATDIENTRWRGRQPSAEEFERPLPLDPVAGVSHPPVFVSCGIDRDDLFVHVRSALRP
jgi:hypothetical protein